MQDRKHSKRLASVEGSANVCNAIFKLKRKSSLRPNLSFRRSKNSSLAGTRRLSKSLLACNLPFTTDNNTDSGKQLFQSQSRVETLCHLFEDNFSEKDLKQDETRQQNEAEHLIDKSVGDRFQKMKEPTTKQGPGNNVEKLRRRGSFHVLWKKKPTLLEKNPLHKSLTDLCNLEAVKTSPFKANIKNFQPHRCDIHVQVIIVSTEGLVARNQYVSQNILK